MTRNLISFSDPLGFIAIPGYYSSNQQIVGYIEEQGQKAKSIQIMDEESSLRIINSLACEKIQSISRIWAVKMKQSRDESQVKCNDSET